MIKVNEDLFHHIFYDFLISKAEKINDDEKKYFDYMIRNINKQIELVSNFMYSKDNADEVLEDLKDNEKLYSKIDDEIRRAVTDKDLEKGSDIIEYFYKKGKENGALLLRSNGDKIWTKFDEDNLENLKKYNLSLIKDINSEVRGAIKEEIFTGIARSDNPRVIAENIKNIPEFEPLPNTGLTAYGRAELIARTEVQRTLNEGHLQSYKDLGIKYVEIAPAPDACEECADWEGEVIDIDEANGLLPIHPNCRCRFIPITEGRDYGFTDEEINDPYMVLPPDVSNLSYEELSTPEEVAAYFGYGVTNDVIYDNSNYIPNNSRYISFKGETVKFYDKENNCELYIAKDYIKNRFVDYKEFVKEFNKLPDILKKKTNTILFSDSKIDKDGSFLGFNRWWYDAPEYGSRRNINKIDIGVQSILSKYDRNSSSDVKDHNHWIPVLAHELGHSLDHHDKENMRQALSGNWGYLNAIRKDPGKYCTVYGKEHYLQIKKENSGADQPTLWAKGAYSEDFAEAVSMTVGYHSEHPEKYVNYLPNGKVYNANDFAKMFPNRLKYIEKELGLEPKT